MRRLYFVGQGGASWRDPRNWSRTPGGAPVRHLHMRGDETVAIGAVAGHDRLDLRGMPHKAVEVTGYEGRLRFPDGSHVNFPASRLGRLRAKFLKRQRLRPRMLSGLDQAVARAGGWERSVRDGIATLILTPRDWIVVPHLAGGAAALVQNSTGVGGNGGGTGAATCVSMPAGSTAGNLLVVTCSASVSTANGTFAESSSLGYTKAVQDVAQSNVQTAIFYKPNCGASETMPSFTYSLSSTHRVMIWEFSGCIKATAVLDKTGANHGAGSGSLPFGFTATTGGTDARSGQLIVTSDAFSFGSNYVESSSDSYNNGATPSGNVNNDSASQRTHYRFAYGITTGNASADTNTPSSNQVGVNSVGSTSVATFKIQVNLTTSATGLTVTDSFARSVTRTISDTGSTISDSTAIRAARVVADTGLTVSDSIAQPTKRTIADTGLTVSGSIAVAVARSISDTGLTVSDSIASVRARAVTDTGLTVSDSIARSASRVLADAGLTVTDAIQKSASHGVSDTALTVTDAISTADQPALIDVGLTVSDSIAILTFLVRSIADTGLAVSDSLAITSATSRSISDTGLTVTDGIGSHPARHIAIADTGLTVSDSFGSLIRVVTITDTGLTIFDELLVPDVPGFAAGATFPPYAAAGAIIVTDRAEGFDFATYGGAINDQPGGLP